MNQKKNKEKKKKTEPVCTHLGAYGINESGNMDFRVDKRISKIPQIQCT